MGSQGRGEIRWEKLVGIAIKVNWDAAVEIYLKRVGLGVAIHDSCGEVLVCLCSIVNFVQKPSMAETLALRRATTLCVELGFSNVILEGDSQVVVKAGKWNGRDMSRLWNYC